MDDITWSLNPASQKMSLAELALQAQIRISREASATELRGEGEDLRKQGEVELKKINDGISSFVLRNFDKDVNHVTYTDNGPLGDEPGESQLPCIRVVSRNCTIGGDGKLVDVKITLGVPRRDQEWADIKPILSYVGIEFPKADMATCFFLGRDKIGKLENGEETAILPDCGKGRHFNDALSLIKESFDLVCKSTKSSS